MHKVNQYGWKYYTELQGPSVVLQDIRLGDLPGLSPGLAARYTPAFENILKQKLIVAQSYDLVTFDQPTDGCQYTRGISYARHELRDLRISDESMPPKEWLANAWHSESPDFFILRMSVVPPND